MGSRVSAVINAQQPVDASVGVDLCCGEARVTEELLDMTHVDPSIKEVRREGVSNHMRVHVLACRGLQHRLVEDATDAPRGEPSSALVQK